MGETRFIVKPFRPKPSGQTKCIAFAASAALIASLLAAGVPVQRHNRLLPNVQAFERVAGLLQVQDAPLVNGAVSHAVEELNKLAAAPEDYKLKMIKLDDLKLKDNPKIKSDVIARIAPIIRDFDDGESDEE